MLTCYLCLEKRPYQLKMNSKKAKDLNCTKIIAQHFWLNPEIEKKSTESICTTCWDVLLAFHELYQTVAKAHNRLESQYEIVDAAFVPEIKVEITDLDLLPKTAVIDDLANDGNENEQNFLPTLEYNQQPEQMQQETEINPKQECTTASDDDSDTDLPLSILLRSKFKPEPDVLDVSNKALDDTSESVNTHSPMPQKKSNRLDFFKTIKSKKNNKKRTRSSSSLDSNDESSSESAVDNKRDKDYVPYEPGELEGKKERRVRKEHSEDRRIEWDETISKYYEKLECATCKVPFINFRGLSRHSMKVHKSKPAVECCKRTFQSRKLLANHATTHIHPRHFICSKCDIAFESKLLLDKHLDEHHRCSVCLKEFPNKTGLKAHKIVKHLPKSEYKYTCTDCPEKFPTQRRFWEHLNVAHNKGNPTMCDKCGKPVRNLHSLRKHMLSHSESLEHKTEPVQCDLCGKWLKHQDSLRGHKYLVHEQRYKQPCSICGKNIQSLHALERHMIHSHQAERKFKCPMCPRAFKINRDLQQHINIHTKAIVYKCDICDKIFYQTSGLHKHKSVYHPNNRVEAPDPVQCQICSNWFTTLPGLKQHIKVVHEVSDQEHRCRICNHMSSNGTALRRHIRRNHGNKSAQKVANEKHATESGVSAEI